MQRIRSGRWIGDRRFYQRLLRIALPIMLQSGITNLVSLLDNIMVGAVGTESMTGVSIVNQLLFVFQLCVFGGLSGAGIFTAQYYGRGDEKGVRDTFRFKLWLTGLLFVTGACILTNFGKTLIGSFLHESGDSVNMAVTESYGQEYLKVMIPGLLPFALCQAYASTLRECGETMLPMKAGILAILVNLILNYLLIFGKLGFPALGPAGAGIATVISRFVECGIVVAWTHTHLMKNGWARGAYRSVKVPGALTRRILVKGMPLLVNEMLWSTGMTSLVQCYSNYGLAVVAGLNISSTVYNLFSVIWMAMGTAVSILVGQQLGAGNYEEARDSVRKIMVFSILSATAVGVLTALLAPLFPLLYNTSQDVRDLATGFIRIAMLATPINSFANVTYFTLRSGGRTWITFLFDSVYIWVFRLPMVLVLIHVVKLPIYPVYALSALSELVKCVLGAWMIRKGIWIRNIVEE